MTYIFSFLFSKNAHHYCYLLCILIDLSSRLDEQGWREFTTWTTGQRKILCPSTSLAGYLDSPHITKLQSANFAVRRPTDFLISQPICYADDIESSQGIAVQVRVSNWPSCWFRSLPPCTTANHHYNLMRRFTSCSGVAPHSLCWQDYKGELKRGSHFCFVHLAQRFCLQKHVPLLELPTSGKLPSSGGGEFLLPASTSVTSNYLMVSNGAPHQMDHHPPPFSNMGSPLKYYMSRGRLPASIR